MHFDWTFQILQSNKTWFDFIFGNFNMTGQDYVYNWLGL